VVATLLASGGLAGLLSTGVVAAPSANAAVQPHDTFGNCTFSAGGHSSSTTSPATPAILTGVTDNETVTVTCSGLAPTTNGSPTLAIAAEASPLSIVAAPPSTNNLEGESYLDPVVSTIGNPVPDQGCTVSSSGTCTLTLNVKSGSDFHGGSKTGVVLAGDPNASCPPTQAQINAGLGTCLISVVNFSAALANMVVINYATALVQFTGQPSPTGAPVATSSAGSAGKTVTLGGGGSGTGWWGSGWWGGGYSGTPANLTYNPQSIPNSDVFVNGAVAPSSSVKVVNPVYCLYGGSSRTSCNASGTLGSGKLFGASLSGTVTLPSPLSGTSAKVQVYQPNVWANFAGNSTNSKFPNYVTGTGSVLLANSGYWMVASDGGVFNYGLAGFFGSMGGKPLNSPMVALAPTANGNGYWEVASDGGVFCFGNAHFFGSMGGRPLNSPIVGMSPTADGRGYWLVASDGGIFSFGDAKFYGSIGGIGLNRPVVGMATTPGGAGYWLVGSDGNVYSFGDATYYGAPISLRLNQSVQNMAATADGKGYWEVGSAGAVLPYGDAVFYGSMAGRALNWPVVSLVPTPHQHGYWEVGADGGLFTFGDAAFYGSMGGSHLNAPIIGAAGAPTT
jgi:hypothetical protein